MAGLGLGLLGKIKWFSAAVKASKVFKALRFIGTIAFSIRCKRLYADARHDESASINHG